MKTFSGLREAVYDHLGLGSSPSTNMVNLVKDWVNETINDINNEEDWYFLKDTYSFSTVANQESYNMPRDLHMVDSVRDMSNHVIIRYTDRRTKVMHDGTFDKSGNTGNPDKFFFWGVSNVKSQPASSGTISVVSSDASDTSGSVFISGNDGTSDLEESLSLNGTSAVTSSGSFETIARLTKTATTTGYITVTDSGSNQLVVLYPNDMHVIFRKMYIDPIPDGVYSMEVDYTKKIKRLVNDNDICGLPPDFESLVIIGAMMKAARWENDYRKRGMWQSEYYQKLGQLQAMHARDGQSDKNIGFRYEGEWVT